MKTMTREEVEALLIARIQGLESSELPKIYKSLFPEYLELKNDQFVTKTYFESVDAGPNAIDPEVRGTRIYNQGGTEYGISLGKSGTYTGEAGASNRIRVLWPDGKCTKPTVSGILFKNRWQIAA